MERTEAIARIRTLIGQDLRPLADVYGVTVWRDGKKNKGWAGHVVERHLGLPLNSSRAPNFGSWELKVIPVRYGRDGVLRIKETMASCMIDPIEVGAKEFEESHLFGKLQKMVVVARIFESQQESRSLVFAVESFDLTDPETYAAVKTDYDLIRETILTQGFEALTGRMGVLVQPRTKGRGHGSVSRAFYARKQFLAHIFRIQ